MWALLSAMTAARAVATERDLAESPLQRAERCVPPSSGVSGSFATSFAGPDLGFFRNRAIQQINVGTTSSIGLVFRSIVAVHRDARP